MISAFCLSVLLLKICRLHFTSTELVLMCGIRLHVVIGMLCKLICLCAFYLIMCVFELSLMKVLCDCRSDKEVKDLKERFLTRGKSLPNLVVYVLRETFFAVHKFTGCSKCLLDLFISFSESQFVFFRKLAPGNEPLNRLL